MIRACNLDGDCDPELRETSPQAIEVKDCLTTLFGLFLGALKDRECQKNWTRLECYLEMLYDIATSSLSAT